MPSPAASIAGVLCCESLHTILLAATLGSFNKHVSTPNLELKAPPISIRQIGTIGVLFPTSTNCFIMPSQRRRMRSKSCLLLEWDRIINFITRPSSLADAQWDDFLMVCLPQCMVIPFMGALVICAPLKPWLISLEPNNPSLGSDFPLMAKFTTNSAVGVFHSQVVSFGSPARHRSVVEPTSRLFPPCRVHTPP